MWGPRGHVLPYDSAAKPQTLKVGGLNHLHHPTERSQNQFSKAVFPIEPYNFLISRKTGGFAAELPYNFLVRCPSGNCPGLTARVPTYFSYQVSFLVRIKTRVPHVRSLRSESHLLQRLASWRLPGSRVRSPHRGGEVFRFLGVALLRLFTLPNLLMRLAFVRFDDEHLTG